MDLERLKWLTPPCAALLLAAAVALSAGQAIAQDIRIGVAAPLTGPSEILGRQIKAGAETAAARLGVTLTVADDSCSAEGGAAAARSFIDANVALATGFLCTEAIEAALPLLKDAGIATIVTGVRTNGLTDSRAKTGWLVARIAPRADAEVAAASSILARLWREAHFAIVDDGTIYSRELAEGFRNAVEQAGLKPVFTDTYRPQLDNQIALAARLRKAGATDVFVAGDRADIAIIGRDAAQLEYRLTIAGGEVLRSAGEDVDLAPGTLMIGIPEWAEIANPETVKLLRDAGIEPEGYVLPGYASIEIAAQAVGRAASQGKQPSDMLSGQNFETAVGPIAFSASGERTDNPYRLFRYESGAFFEVREP